jgi:hypothetical protein
MEIPRGLIILTKNDTVKQITPPTVVNGVVITVVSVVQTCEWVFVHAYNDPPSIKKDRAKSIDLQGSSACTQIGKYNSINSLNDLLQLPPFRAAYQDSTNSSF